VKAQLVVGPKGDDSESEGKRVSVRPEEDGTLYLQKSKVIMRNASRRGLPEKGGSSEKATHSLKGKYRFNLKT